MLKQSDFYHVGIITDDFEDTVEQMGRELGLTWSPVIRVPVPLWTRDHGLMQIESCAVYSQQEPCIEIVRAVPNSPWVALPGRPLHHMGYWVEDLHAASAELEARGCPKVLCAYVDGQMFGMAYHELHNGTYIEIVDRASFADWPAFLAGEMEHEVILPD